MELRHLRYFVAVGEEQHYGRAALRLRVVQPALSRQIQDLEEEVGFKLFERLPRGVKLSAAGKLFLEDARRILQEISEAAVRARRVASGRSGTLRIGFTENSSWRGVVPDSFRRLAIERYGKLDVLVNNAGIAPISLLDELRVDDWEAMIDVNIKGVLYGIAAALPVFRRQGFGHFVNVISTAGIQIIPTMAVYAGTKNAVRTITETLRQEAGDKLRVTGISPGFVQTDLADSMTNPGVKAQIAERMEKMAIPPAAVARAIAFAIEQPAEVDVNEIVIRPTAQA